MTVGKLVTNLFWTTNQLLKKSLSCLLHELDIIAVHKYFCTYRTNRNIHSWCPSAGAARLAKPGRRQTTAPSRPRGELGMPPRPGRPRWYLPGAPDGPPSPPAPTDRPPPAPGHKFSAAMVDDVKCCMFQCGFYFQYRMYRAVSGLIIMFDDFWILWLCWILIVK